MSRFKSEKGQIVKDGPTGYENEDGTVDIYNRGNGIYVIQPTAYSEYPHREVLDSDQIAAALSWWRQQTKLKIISVAQIEETSLLVVTENINEEGKFGEDGSIEDDIKHGNVKINCFGNGIFVIRPPLDDLEDVSDSDQITAALSWWRQQTELKIISVAGIDESSLSSLLGIDKASLLIVTENKEE